MINKDKNRYTVHAPIIGGILDVDELTIGPYIIKRNQFDVEDNPQEKFISMFSKIIEDVSQQTEYSILFKVEAASKEKAIELAIPYFELFELVTKFLLKNMEYAQIGIINFSNYTLQQISVTCDTDVDVSISLKPQNATLPINFSQLINNDECKFVWDLINKKFLGKANKMQCRILHAIEWIGRAEREHQSANKYVEYVFAIETLLTFNPAGTIITPSIANQLSEYATFIISESNEVEESKKEFRMILMKRFKRIYQNRSKIVHGSNKDIFENDIQDAIEAVILLVNSFIKNKQLSNFSEIEELASWVDDLKFS